MQDQRDRLRDLLAQKALLRKGEFTLASGSRSDEYMDVKAVTYLPEGVEAVGQLVLEKIAAYEVDAVGGLTIGADAIVLSVVSASSRLGPATPGFIVRKDPKPHGLQKQIEGVLLPENSRVAVVDDVVTTGGSVIKAIEALRKAKISVEVVVPLVDREEGGREAIKSLDIPFEPIFTLTEIHAAANLSHPLVGKRVAHGSRSLRHL